MPIILGGSLFPIFGESMDYGSVLVGSICLGIAVDDTIHIVVNYQKHVKEGFSPEESRGILGGNMLRIAEAIWPK